MYNPRSLLVGRRYIRLSWLFQRLLFLSPFQVCLVPFLWSDLSLFLHPAALIEGFLVDDVEYNLRIHVSAGRTRACVGIGIVCCRLEICDGINRVAVEHGISPFVQYPKSVEQLIYVG